MTSLALSSRHQVYHSTCRERPRMTVKGHFTPHMQQVTRVIKYRVHSEAEGYGGIPVLTTAAKSCRNGATSNMQRV